MSRLVTVQLRGGGSVVVTEPAWCVVSHREPVGEPAEVVHEGAEVALTVATSLGPFRILGAALDQAPLSSRDRSIRAAVDLGGEFAGLDPQGLRDLAAGLVVHAGRLRDLAAELQTLRDAEAQR